MKEHDQDQTYLSSFVVLYVEHVIISISDILTNPRRIDYLLISHFIMNLQDIATTSSRDADSSRPSFVRSEQSQVSSIQFDRVVGNLGEFLRDDSRGGEEDEENEEQIDENVAVMNSSQKDGEMQVESAVFSSGENVCQENVAGPSRFFGAIA